jgi:glucose-6-phosphate 1-epimerase
VVPVIFPQFGTTGRGPRHGFARQALWEAVSQTTGSDDALSVLRLRDDEATRTAWPHAFELELAVRIAGSELDIELACENTGAEPISFTAALHTYLAISDAQQRTELLLPDGSGATELDRIYHQARGPLLLTDQPLNQPTRRLLINQQGFDDVVVWNPGAARCAQLGDMPADGWRRMLCVEAACIGVPVSLGAGESWVARQSLRLL